MLFLHHDKHTVFPSEVLADFYKRDVLKGNKCAMLSSCFQSWDVFRDNILRKKDTETCPINLHGRYFFCRKFLDQQGSSFSLAEHGDDQCAKTQLLDILVDALPELPLICAYPTDSPPSRKFSKKLRISIDVLYRCYREFLEQTDMYEQNWAIYEQDRFRNKKKLSENVVLFLPELYKNAGWIEEKNNQVISLDNLPEPDVIRFTPYPHTNSEIEHTMEQIEKLLNKGTRREDIVITVAGLNYYRDSMKIIAQYYAVPLSFHAKITLAEYPESRLFVHMYRCWQEHCAVEDLEEMILDPSVSWKHSPLWRKLLTLGKRSACIRGAVTPSRNRWRACLTNKYLRNLYEHCSNKLRDIHNATSFAALKTQLEEFIEIFLETPLDISNRNSGMGRAMHELETLEHTEKQLQTALGKGSLHPWEHFITWMRKHSYTPPHNENSIPVYPYGVSAGIHPPYHFILNFSHDDTRRRKHPPLQLNEQQMQQISLHQQDMTEVSVRAYCRSGEHITCSYAIDRFGTPCIPRYSVLADIQPTEKSAPLRKKQESGWWNGTEKMETLSSLQKKGMEHQLLSGLRTKIPDYRKKCIADPELRSMLSSRIRSLSPTSIDRFLRCPFSFLLHDVLKLYREEDNNDAAFLLNMGTVYHNVLRDVFFQLQHQTLSSDVAALDMLDDIIAQNISGNKLVHIAADLKVQKKKIRYVIQKCLDILLENFTGWSPVGVEQDYSAQIAGETVSGAIDLVLQWNERIAVIDYKKSSIPTKKDFSDTEYATVQIPLYCTLLSLNTSKNVTEAYYYSLEQAKLQQIFSYDNQKKALLDHNTFTAWRNSMPGRIAEIRKCIERGDYRCKQGCEYCSAPALSRSCYTIE